jgi:hypothetical protein
MIMSQPNNHKDYKKLWLGPFKVRGSFVNETYYLNKMQGKRSPLPISFHLLKPDCGEET